MEIDNILAKAVPCTEDERFVLDVYESYKNGIPNSWGERGVVVDYEKKLLL